MKTRRQEDKKTRRQEAERDDTVVTVALTDMAQTGEAIGRVDGVVLFVPFGAPGDQAEVVITERKRTFARGRLVRLLEAAPQRVTPRCPYFTVCGGCEWQHLPYAEQVHLKTEHVRSHLIRIGKVTEPHVLPCVPSPQPYGYRNHARLQQTPTGAIGYRAARSHEVVAINTCPILEPELDEAVQRLAVTPPASATGEMQLRVAMPLTIGAYNYQFGTDAFFQANTAIAAQLVTAVLQALTLQGKEQVLELYCGGGLFTIPMAATGATLLGIEANAAAIADAQSNAQVAGVGERITLLAASVETALTDSLVLERQWDAIVLDPPRAGVTPAALTSLLTLSAPKVVYVSCDPATLARDAQILCTNGYRLCYAQPFDMFPQTHHVETVALFERLGYV